MADDAWIVNNPQVQHFNDVLILAVKSCAHIINSVDETLATMPSAAQTSALSPWHDLKVQWTNAYNDMVMRLQSTSIAGQEAHEAYVWGDRQSYAIML
jgi:hypothetical protein